MSVVSSVKRTAASGGSRPIMRSVNVLVTADICEKLGNGNTDSRSAAVRNAAAIVIDAQAKGHDWVIPEILSRIEDTSPKKRREDEENGIRWDKAIVWVPETMLREIERIGRPNNIRVSEFLRGVVVFATEDQP